MGGRREPVKQIVQFTSSAIPSMGTYFAIASQTYFLIPNHVLLYYANHVIAVIASALQLAGVVIRLQIREQDYRPHRRLLSDTFLASWNRRCMRQVLGGESVIQPGKGGLLSKS